MSQDFDSRDGSNEAIIFSTHILEGWRRVLARISSIAADRGDGTPRVEAALRTAWSVTLRLLDGSSALVTQKLNQISTVERCVVLAESPVSVRAYLKKNGERGELARAIAELAATERWKIAELHTEEGRLDEVFRNITLPDTKQEEAK